MPKPKEYLYNLVTYKTKGPIAGMLRGFLRLFSLVYGLAVVVLAFIYRIKPARFKAKVVSVGNITLGGTGKTTLVEYLCVKLGLAGRKIAVLTRGYQRDSRRQGAQGFGDEPAMLREKLPFVRVIVDKDRVKAGFRAIKDFGTDTLILDDGLQQWKISKDLEIVSIDAGNPFGNFRLLPAGFLREPIRALARADIFVLTQIRPGQDTEKLTDQLKRLNSRALIVESQHKPVGFRNIDRSTELLSSDSLKGKRAAIFSGIGNPGGFQDCICALGINIVQSFKFADHYDYTPADINSIINSAGEKCLDVIITTEKDAVKIRELGIKGSGILVLEIKLEITKNEAEFDRRLLKLYSL